MSPKSHQMKFFTRFPHCYLNHTLIINSYATKNTIWDIQYKCHHHFLFVEITRLPHCFHFNYIVITFWKTNLHIKIDVAKFVVRWFNKISRKVARHFFWNFVVKRHIKSSRFSDLSLRLASLIWMFRKEFIALNYTYFKT